MAAKVLKTLVVAIGVLVVALLAFIAVYLIGYGLFAIFSHSGMGAGAARGIGTGIAAVAAIVVLWLFFRSRAARTQAAQSQHTHRKHAA